MEFKLYNLFMTKRIPWNKGIKTGLVPKSAFTKGSVPWNKGLHIYLGGKRFEKGLIPWNKVSPKKNCVACGKEFHDNPKRMEKAKYCSQKCYWGQLNGRKLTDIHKNKIREASIRLFKNKEYREKRLSEMLNSLIKRPTSYEKKIISVIKKYNLPYKYVGNGEFWIGSPSQNPDFVNINGEKKLIEVGNVYHHQGDYVEKRKKNYLKYGWKSFFLIQDRIDRMKDDQIVSFFKLISKESEGVR